MGIDIVLATLALVSILVVLAISALVARRKPAKLNTERFNARWLELQKLCAHETTWPLAVINADKLLDEALKARRYKGKTMGERLVSAQRDFANNDTVWFGHKLRNKLVHEEVRNMKRREVEQALRGFRQALQDLGAL